MPMDVHFAGSFLVCYSIGFGVKWSAYVRIPLFFATYFEPCSVPRFIRRFLNLLLLFVFLNTTVLSVSVSTAEENPETDFHPNQIEFFEKKIRPVLVEHCYQCHSAKAAENNKLRGGLFLDTRAGLLTGGESGPAVDLEDSEQSILLDALRYESYEMPPKGKLPEKVIADFAKWIEGGLADPRLGDKPRPISPTIDIEQGRKHWAYQRIEQPTIPDLEEGDARSPVDSFISAKLREHGLTQLPIADRTTLIRRLFFDLVGLPPTPVEIDAFEKDRSEDAYQRLVERLIASPQFGERWGRRWLDSVRYAESITLRGFILPEAWRYRDYVIDQFNTDRPFDRFIREQVAGDLLPAESIDDRRRNLIATSFLTLGNNNLEDQDKEKLRMDVVDEQLETIGRGLLAQTIGCARCHDHKFDPIPTADYYALAGILKNTKTLEHANVSKWLEVPIPMAPELEEVVSENELAVANVSKRLQKLKAKKSTTPAPVELESLSGIVVDDSEAKLRGSWKKSTHVKSYIGVGYRHDSASQDPREAAFIPVLPRSEKYEIRFAFTPGPNRSKSVPVKVVSADGESIVRINQRKAAPIDGRFVSLGTFRMERGKQHGVFVSNQGVDGHLIIDAVQFLPEETSAELAKRDKSSGSSGRSDRKSEIARLEKELVRLKRIAESGPQREKSMSIQEEDEIADARIHIRGDVHNLGDKAPRGFLQVAMVGPAPEFPTQQSGRIQLGDWLTSAKNPLPSRVIANRIWHWLFGVGLVRTTDDFGHAGESPSHPELLDYLASRLLQGDWSTKKIIREIVLSRTYRSVSHAEVSATLLRNRKLDPQNRLLWRMNRRRLDAECLADSILHIGGQLDLAIGGSTIRKGVKVDYDYSHESKRRAVYWPVFRNSLPGIFEVFDFANPSMVVGRRDVSSSPPQALFMMNNPFILVQAERAATRHLENEVDMDVRVNTAFRMTLGRFPTASERESIVKFILQNSDVDITASWTQVFHSLFASMDFRYVK